MANESGLLISLNNKVRLIKFNRPKSKNAINQEMYFELGNLLNKDASNDDIVVTILTGVGEYFSSGNDIKSAMGAFSQEDGASTGLNNVKELVNAFINYPKLIIAVVNGPAIGIGATMCALCDIVYSSDRGSFEIPFMRLGLSLEGCSSLLLPAILGKSKAAEMLYLNHVLTADEALKFNFVAKVIPHGDLDNFISKLHTYGELSVGSVIRNKRLFNEHMKKSLLDCNINEINALKDCFDSEEFGLAIQKFMTRKSKL